MKDKIKIEDDYRITFLASAAGRKVLLDMIARSKLFSGLLTESDIPVANFVMTILNRCGLFGCIEDENGIHYPTASTLRTLADIYDVDFADIRQAARSTQEQGKEIHA